MYCWASGPIRYYSHLLHDAFVRWKTTFPTSAFSHLIISTHFLGFCVKLFSEGLGHICCFGRRASDGRPGRSNMRVQLGFRITSPELTSRNFFSGWVFSIRSAPPTSAVAVNTSSFPLFAWTLRFCHPTPLTIYRAPFTPRDNGTHSDIPFCCWI